MTPDSEANVWVQLAHYLNQICGDIGADRVIWLDYSRYH